MENKFRSKNFCLVLYPEDETHREALVKLATNYDYVSIVHDKDIYESGEQEGKLKKPHWHVVLRFKNAVWNSSIAKELGITMNYLEPCRDLRNSLLYLIHYNNPEKAQYDIADVVGPLGKELPRLINVEDKSESEIMLEIRGFIQSNQYLSIDSLLVWACEQGYYSYVRRSSYFLKGLLEEHNRPYVRCER